MASYPYGQGCPGASGQVPGPPPGGYYSGPPQGGGQYGSGVPPAGGYGRGPAPGGPYGPPSGGAPPGAGGPYGNPNPGTAGGPYSGAAPGGSYGHPAPSPYGAQNPGPSGQGPAPGSPPVNRQQANQKLLEEMELLWILAPPVKKRSRTADDRCAPTDAATKSVTWGDLKRLTSEAEELLRKVGKPETPENLLLAMMTRTTINSKQKQLSG